MPYREHQPTRFVNVCVALQTKTAMAIAEIYLVVLIAANEQCGQLPFLPVVTATGVQHFDPFQYLPQIPILCSRITDDASTQCLSLVGFFIKRPPEGLEP